MTHYFTLLKSLRRLECHDTANKLTRVLFLWENRHPDSHKKIKELSNSTETIHDRIILLVKEYGMQLPLIALFESRDF